MSTKIIKLVCAAGLALSAMVGLSGCQQLLTLLGLSHTLTVTVSPADAGYVSKAPDLSYYSTGAKVQLTATANTGYKFSKWSGDATGVTNPLTMTMDADKLVTATFEVSDPTSKDLTAFGFPYLGATGVIDQTAHTVSVTVPSGANVHSLVATFTTTGTQVKVGSTVQTSGVTANDFTSPVTYTVVAGDASTQSYVVTVSVGISGAKVLNAFGFLSPAVAGAIDQTLHTVTVTVPTGTDKTGLVATFTTTGAQVKVGTNVQTSGATANDFTNPVTYTVVAADSSTQNYVVTVNVAAASDKALTSFGFPALGVAGSIDQTEHTVALLVPSGTNVTSLVATFTITGAQVKVGTNVQTSGTTPNNFSSPLTYTVVAADSSTQDYVVMVTVAASSSKTLTSFGFDALGAVGVIDQIEHIVAVVVPSEAVVSNLVATFTSTGTQVTVAGAVQTSGVTANDFTNPVLYTVRAADTTTQDYVVVVVGASSSAKALQSFGFASPMVTGTINEAAHTVAVWVPQGTDVTALVAVFASSPGSTVTVADTWQFSGQTANNFTSPVTYTVTAQDSSTQDYVVTVTVLTGATVYTAGSYFDGTAYRPSYWTGTTRTVIGESLYAAYANSLFVYAGTVYTAGVLFDGIVEKPGYWAATVFTDLSTGTQGGVANSIFVTGGTALTAGYWNNGGRYVPAYWSGTTRNDLGVGTNNGYATSIYYSGGTVYTGGYWDDAANSIRVPCYWTNSSRRDLGDGTHDGAVTSVYVAGSVVYTGGYWSDGTKDVPCYWIGGVRYDIGDGAHSGRVTSIYVSGSTVYTGGYWYNDLTKVIPFYWTAGTRTDIGDGTHDAWVFDIAVVGGTIYTAGFWNDGTKFVPSYWAGGTRTDLPGDGAHDAKAVAISVQ